MTIPRRSRPARRTPIERKSRPNKRRKSLRARLTEELDRVVGANVRARGRCESGRGEHNGPLQWCHLWSRAYKHCRWAEWNSWAMCSGCHCYYTFRPAEWTAHLIRVFGQEKYDAYALQVRANVKLSTADLAEMLERAKRGETL